MGSPQSVHDAMYDIVPIAKQYRHLYFRMGVIYIPLRRACRRTPRMADCHMK